MTAVYKGMLATAVVLTVLVLLVVATGFALPVAHVASREVLLAHTPERVFAVLAHVEDYPHWRSDIRAVEVVAREPAMRWREYGRDTMTLERVELAPPRRLVTRIADPDLPFGGRWIFELEPDAGGTRLRITEEGEVYNPVFRFMSRFVFGHAATIERFLSDLERRLQPS